MLSVTRLGTANACLKKYHFAYEYGGAGLEPREKSLPLTLGSLVHASLEAFYRGDALPPLEGAGELLDQAREAVGTYTLYARLHDRFDVVDVERRFEVVFEDTLFTGVIDAVVRVDGQLYLLEHKTCSQFWPVNREVLAPQHVLYELAAEEIYGEPVAGTIYNFIRLTKRKGEHHAEVRRVIIPADEEVRLSHYNDAADTLELMRLSKLRPRNVGPHCGSCYFASLCIADLRREDTHDLATRDFLRKESHEPALSP